MKRTLPKKHRLKTHLLSGGEGSGGTGEGGEDSELHLGDHVVNMTSGKEAVEN